MHYHVDSTYEILKETGHDPNAGPKEPSYFFDGKTRRALKQIRKESDAQVSTLLMEMDGVPSGGFSPRTIDLLEDAIKMGLVARKRPTRKDVDFDQIERQIEVEQSKRLPRTTVSTESLEPAQTAAEATLAIFYDRYPAKRENDTLLYEPRRYKRMQILQVIVPALTNLEATLRPKPTFEASVQTGQL